MYRNLINYNDTSYEELSALSLSYENGNQDRELISCASRYLLDYKSKCSINQVQPLAKVWTVKHFRSYINRAIFGVVSAHQAPKTAVKSIHGLGNQTYSSLLTSKIVRSSPFDIDVVHQHGRAMGNSVHPCIFLKFSVCRKR